MGLFGEIKKIWYGRTNTSYIEWLRSKGIQIGEDVLFRDRLTTLIDYSRPALVKIGSNVDINRHFQILTHDWACYVIRGRYHDFVNSEGGGNNWEQHLLRYERHHIERGDDWRQLYYRCRFNCEP